MATYKYKAISPEGKKITGTIEAYDEYHAVDEIRKNYGVIEQIECLPEKKEPLIKLDEPLSISNKTLALVSSQFAILTRAGIPLPQAVKQTANQTSDRYMKKLLTKVSEDVNAGFGLAESFEKNSNKLPAIFIETIRAGEASGTLSDSFDKLTVYFDKLDKTQSKVKSALRYPLFLLAMAVVVVAVVLKVALPTIIGVIEETGGEIPGPTKFLINLTGFFEKYGWLILILLIALIGFCIYYNSTPKGKLFFGDLALKLPLFGKLNIQNASALFANTMATLLSSGQTVVEALNITAKVINNAVLSEGIKKSAEAVTEGTRLATAIATNVPQFQGILVDMIAAGDSSGKLPETLATIGEYYDAESAQTSQKLIGTLEPVMTLVLGAVIGFIVIALYLPMFTMYNGM